MAEGMGVVGTAAGKVAEARVTVRREAVGKVVEAVEVLLACAWVEKETAVAVVADMVDETDEMEERAGMEDRLVTVMAEGDMAVVGLGVVVVAVGLAREEAERPA